VGHWPAVAVLVGLLASVAYGAADFIGGVVSRRNHVFTVLLWGQFTGMALVLVGLPLLPDGELTAETALLGAAAGVAGVLGAAFLFRGLARGRMSVVAPITAVLAASLPVLFGLLTGERPSMVTLIGVVVALGAIALVSAAPEPGSSRETRPGILSRAAADGVPEGLAAGLCFAVFFILLDGVDDGAGLWSILAVRVSSMVIAGLVVLLGPGASIPAPGSRLGVAAAGLIGTAADYLFVLGSTLGLLSVVVVLTSLYPVTTVVLARTVLKERIAKVQLAGLVLAAVGVVLITAG
jgi:drug/metabolite transporter (DMT)-like permease